MDAAGYTAIFSAAGITVINLIGLGISIGIWRTTLKTLRESHGKLKTEFIEHKSDRTIHIDPERDAASEDTVRKAIADGFANVNVRLDRIDSRCEGRGRDCANHFESLGNRISAWSGKANGE